MQIRYTNRSALVGSVVAAVFLLVNAALARADDQNDVASIKAISAGAMKTYHLKALIVQVRSGGNNVYTGALGDSMTSVPATPSMHFRNGAMAFTYIATILLELVDEKKAKLDDNLSQYMPELPHADRITLKNLANMTSGYGDYVYQPEVLNGVVKDPFRKWTPEELIQIGVSAPMMFEPGTNWGYCHTNYVILGRVIEKITGMSLANAMQRYVIGMMGLRQTRSIDSPQIPEPVLHTFSSERREGLGIKPGAPFYEESTFWDPSWTTAQGAVQVTDITDMNLSMEAVGVGKGLSDYAFGAQLNPTLVGFGHADPKCPACRALDPNFNYGLGVLNIGHWITQTKSFAGAGATVGYLPSQKLSVAVSVTLAAAAFDDRGNYKNPSPEIFSSLVNAVAPNTLPKPPAGAAFPQ